MQKDRRWNQKETYMCMQQCPQEIHSAICMKFARLITLIKVTRMHNHVSYTPVRSMQLRHSSDTKSHFWCWEESHYLIFWNSVYAFEFPQLYPTRNLVLQFVNKSQKYADRMLLWQSSRIFEVEKALKRNGSLADQISEHEKEQSQLQNLTHTLKIILKKL